MTRLLNQLLDRILNYLVAYRVRSLQHRIKTHESRLQREQANIDYLESRLKCLHQAEKADLN